eukprot:NODE_15335_length_1055_cov_6.058190.p1 GENE.NODE_15335_length_1055_cov_6.058190~~NODE_15335_length_1055_cov_6.058190.p1  ORF type:complete len:279 (-),score=84.43 NODE_15335_length_1055_cov_6.058190:218-934(-)
MAWRSSGTSNDSLVDNLRAGGCFKHGRVEAAMRRLDRASYVRDTSSAYEDCPQPIGHGVTISAPHMHAMCLELLEPYLQPGMKALDCGSGTGYLTAAMMCLVTEGGAKGGAFGIEYIRALVPWSIENVCKDGKTGWIEDPDIFELKHGDGSLGWEEKGPFNAIHVGAAAPKIPKPLVQQLARPGRLVIPVGPQGGAQNLLVIDRDVDDKVTMRNEMGVRYVPFHMADTEAYDPRAAEA